MNALAFALRSFARELRSGEVIVLLAAVGLAVSALTAVGFLTDRIGKAVSRQANEVLAADLRISVPGANFFYPVMKLGFLPQPSDPPRLVRLIGPARAKLILMGGARLSAEEAFAMGLVDRIANELLCKLSPWIPFDVTES